MCVYVCKGFTFQSTKWGHVERSQFTKPYVYLAGLVLQAVNQYSAHSFARNWQLPFLNKQKRENDRRKYFMVNLHERMLLTWAGVVGQTRGLDLLVSSWACVCWGWGGGGGWVHSVYSRLVNMYWFINHSFLWYSIVQNMHSCIKLSHLCLSVPINLKGHWQTVQTQIRCCRMQHLIRVFTVCIKYRNFYKTW